MHRPWLLSLSLLGLMLAFVLGSLLWHAVGVSSLARVAEQVEYFQSVALGIRLGLIVLLIGFWPWIIDRVSRRQEMDGAGRQRLLSLRWRLLAWLLILELLIGQNLFGHFLHGVTETLP